MKGAATLLLELELAHVALLFSCMRTLTARTRDITTAVPDVAGALGRYLTGEVFSTDLTEIIRAACEGDAGWCWTTTERTTTKTVLDDASRRRWRRDDRGTRIKVTIRLARKASQRREGSPQSSVDVFRRRLALLLREKSLEGEWKAVDETLHAAEDDEAIRFHPLFDVSAVVTARILT